jgi:hypothetical protein
MLPDGDREAESSFVLLRINSADKPGPTAEGNAKKNNKHFDNFFV